MSLIFSPAKRVKYSGEYSFAFTLDSVKEENGVSMLIVNAHSQNLPIPVQCVWKRVRGKKEYGIPLVLK